MRRRLQTLRLRTDGFTVTPAAYGRVAWVALAALTLIVLSGAAVRLTGSGLGCPDWPRCYGRAYPPLTAHAVIEFSNRMITTPVALAAIAAVVLARRRRPYRPELFRLSLLLPLGVLGQAVLGGFTVRGALDYGWVMAHFALSMLILVAAVALTWAATHEPGQSRSAARGGRRSVWPVRALVPLAAVTVLAGTAATAAGPHAGGSPGQRINRLSFDGGGTLDFVIHRHGEIGLFLGLASLGVWWWLGRQPAPDAQVRRALSWVCPLIAAQGFVGLVQYETHLPTQLVWLHVALACGVWLTVLWSAAAAGSTAVSSAPLGERRIAHRPSVPA